VSARSFRLPIAVTTAAVALACLWFVAGYPTLIYDSWGYYFLAGVLRTAGLAGWPTDVRTYGYPLFEALVTGFRDVPPEEFRLALFVAQLVVYLAACAFVARQLGRVFASPRLGVAAYAIGALNPVLLLHVTEPLSDLLSAVLVLVAVALTWRLPEDAPGRAPAWQPFLCFLCAGAAVVVRPANLIVVAALAAAWVLRGLIFRDLGARHLGGAVLGLVPPFLPQVLINRHLFGTFNPLIEKNLYSLQAAWGMAALKYGTLVMPGRSPLLVYANPLYAGDPSPAAFFHRDPTGYVATLLLHGFGMLDRDLPFTLVTDFAPWYRWPLAVANLFVVYLALAGLALGTARLLRRRGVDEGGFVVASTAVVAAAYLALHLPVEVESRFGLPLLALATPSVTAGLAAIGGGRLRPRSAVLVLLGALPAIAGALLLSAWIGRQRTNPPVQAPTRTQAKPSGAATKPSVER
jgi:hypothetical protein